MYVIVTVEDKAVGALNIKDNFAEEQLLKMLREYTGEQIEKGLPQIWESSILALGNKLEFIVTDKDPKTNISNHSYLVKIEKLKMYVSDDFKDEECDDA